MRGVAGRESTDGPESRTIVRTELESWARAVGAYSRVMGAPANWNDRTRIYEWRRDVTRVL